MPRIEDRNAPVAVRAQRAVPRFGRAERRRGALQLPVTGRDADFVRTYARLSRAPPGLVLAYPWRHEEELVYRAAGGLAAVRGTPPPRTVESPFGTVHGSTHRGRGRRSCGCRSSLDVTRARIAPADYAAFPRASWARWTRRWPSR